VILGLSTAQIPPKAPSGRGRALRYIPMPPSGMGMPLRSLISYAPVTSTGFVELGRLRRVANFNRLFAGLGIGFFNGLLMDSLIQQMKKYTI